MCERTRNPETKQQYISMHMYLRTYYIYTLSIPLTDASSLKITFRSDESESGRGIFGVVFEIPIPSCSGKIKRTAYKDYEELALPHHFEEELPYHCPQDYHPYQNSRTPCVSITQCITCWPSQLHAIYSRLTFYDIDCRQLLSDNCTYSNCCSTSFPK